MQGSRQVSATLWNQPSLGHSTPFDTASKYRMSNTSEPRWLINARKYIGLAETPGPRNNATIMAWAKKLGSKILGIVYTDDSATPWCGLFVAECLAEAGLTPPPIAVRASAYDKWGVAVAHP